MTKATKALTSLFRLLEKYHYAINKPIYCPVKTKKKVNVYIWPTTYLPLLTFVDIWTTTYLPRLVNVVCERPLILELVLSGLSTTGVYYCTKNFRYFRTQRPEMSLKKMLHITWWPLNLAARVSEFFGQSSNNNYHNKIVTE